MSAVATDCLPVAGNKKKLNVPRIGKSCRLFHPMDVWGDADTVSALQKPRHYVMKNLTIIILFVASAQAFAQGQPCQKIGFADMQMIAQQLPETRQMDAELSSLGGQLQNQLNARYSVYNQRLQEIEHPSPAADDAALQQKRDELQKLEEEIRKFSSDAESSFRKKQEELMRPIMLKIDRSVREVATENDYSIIINTSISGNQNLLMFGAPAYDVSDLVLKKMGVTINQHKR